MISSARSIGQSEAMLVMLWCCSYVIPFDNLHIHSYVFTTFHGRYGRSPMKCKVDGPLGLLCHGPHIYEEVYSPHARLAHTVVIYITSGGICMY